MHDVSALVDSLSHAIVSYLFHLFRQLFGSFSCYPFPVTPFGASENLACSHYVRNEVLQANTCANKLTETPNPTGDAKHRAAQWNFKKGKWQMRKEFH